MNLAAIDLARPTVRDGDFWWYVDLELDLWESSAEPPALTQSTVMHATTGEVLRDLIIDPRKDYQPRGRPKN